MQSITNDDHSLRLMGDNPWWDFSSGFEKKLPSQLKRDVFPAFYRSIQDLGQGTALVVAGTLGVGKTVMLHQAVARLIEEGVPPSAVFFCSLVSPNYGSVELIRLLEMFTARHGHGQEAELYVFFDEIQYTGN